MGKDCEQKFSKLEAWFCIAIYDPWLSGKDLSVTYSEEFGLFVASLAFRYLRFVWDKNPTEIIPVSLNALYQSLRNGLLTDSLEILRRTHTSSFFSPSRPQTGSRRA